VGHRKALRQQRRLGPLPRPRRPKENNHRHYRMNPS
jgi:hypothetical protein